MKHVLIILLLLMQNSCSSSSDGNANPLIGTWVSNCHERTDATGAFIAYAIRRLEISDSTIVATTLDQTDISCSTSSGNTFIINQIYILGEQVMTTDGVTAQRITLDSDFNFFGQPIKTTTESIFRITGVDLNFGGYINGVTPSLDYAITYIKQ